MSTSTLLSHPIINLVCDLINGLNTDINVEILNNLKQNYPKKLELNYSDTDKVLDQMQAEHVSDITRELATKLFYKVAAIFDIQNDVETKEWFIRFFADFMTDDDIISCCELIQSNIDKVFNVSDIDLDLDTDTDTDLDLDFNIELVEIK